MSGVRRGRGRPAVTTASEIRGVALRLFAERGYAAVTLSDIAAEVGIGRTTLFSHFAAKQDLLWEEYDASTARLTAALDAAAPEADAMGVIVEALIEANHFGVADHDALAERWRIVESDPTLLAATIGRQADVVRRLIDFALSARPRPDESLTRATVAATFSAAFELSREWAQSTAPTLPLDEFVRTGLTPIADRLRELLE